MTRRLILVLAVVAGLATGSALWAGPAPKGPALPSWSKQIAIREGWLRLRHELILPMMRRHEVAMWIAVNEEFHNDPIVHTIAPPRP